MESLHNHLLKFIGTVTSSCLWKNDCWNLFKHSISVNRPSHCSKHTHTPFNQWPSCFSFSVRKCTLSINLNLLRTVMHRSHVIHRVEKVLRFSHTDAGKKRFVHLPEFLSPISRSTFYFNAFQFEQFSLFRTAFFVINYVFNFIWLSLFDRVFENEGTIHRQYQIMVYVSFVRGKKVKMWVAEFTVLRNKLRFTATTATTVAAAVCLKVEKGQRTHFNHVSNNGFAIGV